MPDGADLVDLYEDWLADKDVRKRVLVDNPSALYWA